MGDAPIGEVKLKRTLVMVCVVRLAGRGPPVTIMDPTAARSRREVPAAGVPMTSTDMMAGPLGVETTSEPIAEPIGVGCTNGDDGTSVGDGVGLGEGLGEGDVPGGGDGEGGTPGGVGSWRGGAGAEGGVSAAEGGVPSCTGRPGGSCPSAGGTANSGEGRKGGVPTGPPGGEIAAGPAVGI